MSAAADPAELGAFLKACRARMTLAEAGLPDNGTRRKVAGLRREEVAQLAVISVDYCTRLEQHDARTAVAALRMQAARDADDPELARLVGDLSVTESRFRSWWAGHAVSSTGSGIKHYRHPVVGDLTLDCDTWGSPDGSGQRLMVLTAEPGTPSHDALRILASWTADGFEDAGRAS